MSKFTIDMTRFEEQAAYGANQISVGVQVEGFWSEPITVRVKRGWGGDGTWEIEVSHSSGGYDSKQCDLMVAERNFAEALLATLDFAETLTARIPEFEAGHQRLMAEYERQAAEARAAKEAAVAADPAIGEQAARAYVDALIANARQVNGPRVRQLKARGRGTESVCSLIAQRSWNDKVTLRFNGNSIGRKEAIAKLADLAFAGLVPDAMLSEDEARKLQQ